MRHRLQLAAALSCLLPLGGNATEPGTGYDPDGDGISEVWEACHGLVDPEETSDLDGDGRSDRLEALQGTDPHDPESRLMLAIEAAVPNAHLLSWSSRTGKRYGVEGLDAEGNWSELPTLTDGNGATSVAVVADPAGLLAYRLALVEDVALNPQIPIALSGRDTDGDGVEDWIEWRAGTSLVDPGERFAIETLASGAAVRFEWPSETGWTYRLETFVDGVWTPLDGEFEGHGSPQRHAMECSEPGALFRLVSETGDRDRDGLLDWEESLLGLDADHPNSREVDRDDWTIVEEELALGGRVSIESLEPVVIAGSNGSARVRLRREGGFKGIEVPITYGGDGAVSGAFSGLPGTVSFGFGQQEVDLELPVGSLPAESGNLTVTPGIGPHHSLAEDPSRTVTCLVENLINVRDHGVVGDGIADDRDALQAVIDLLEASPEFNGLYFPAGTYRLASNSGDTSAPTGSRRVLKLGIGDLSGRDLILRGEPGATLYSDQGSTRAHVLMAVASFRSLSMEGLRIEQSSSPLSPLNQAEPNGSDGVSILRHDERRVAAVHFRDCDFVNCHRSVSIYSVGYDVRGHLESLRFESCRFLNPYGANTINGEAAWGGGQQVYVSPWAGDASYLGCLFDGGGEDMTLTGFGSGGKLKDGSHFGSPLRLRFAGNVVRRTGVESLFQTNDNTLMGWSAAAFAVPETADGASASFAVTATPSTYQAGQIIVIRTPLVPGSSPSNTVLRVEDYQAESRTLTVSNPGADGSLPAGSIIESGRFIYLDDKADPTVAEVVDNLFDGTIPPGGTTLPVQKGIVFNARAMVRRNAVMFFSRGISSYEEVHTPLHPAARGAVVEDNLVIARDPRAHNDVFSIGIDLWGGDERIRGNRIIAEAGFRTRGLRLYSQGAVVAGNEVAVSDPEYNGYASSNRTVGIAIGPYSGGVSARANTTRGWDVGIGPEIPFEGRSYWLHDHSSEADALPADPRGLQNPG